jgi:hypothetical protein
MKATAMPTSNDSRPNRPRMNVARSDCAAASALVREIRCCTLWDALS